MTCLVTGGGSGIGRASAHRIARVQPVVLADVDLAAAEAVAQEVRRAGGEAVAIACDVRSPASCADAVAACTAFGPLTDVVNSAGIVDRSDAALADSPADVWERVVAVNLLGAANVIRATLPRLLESGGGDIVLVASVAALQGRPGISAYSASKAGLLGLQMSLVADYGRSGIRTNCVCPGPTDTAMARDPSAAVSNARRRYASADEVAAAVAWLTHDDSNWMVGAVLPLDAGETAAVARAFDAE